MQILICQENSGTKISEVKRAEICRSNYPRSEATWDWSQNV